MKFLSVLAIFLAFEAIVAVPVNDGDDIVKDLEIVLKDILVGLNWAIDEYEKVKAEYDEDPDKGLHEVIAEIVKIANDLYNGITEEVDQFLDLLENDLNESGKKGVACIRKNRANLRNIIDNLVTDSTKCLSKDIPKLLNAAEGLVAAGKEVRDVLSVAESKLEKCTSGLVCLLELVKDLKGLVTPLEDVLKSLPALLLEIIEDVKNDVPACGKSFLNELKESLIALIDNTMDCIVY